MINLPNYKEFHSRPQGNEGRIEEAINNAGEELIDRLKEQSHLVSTEHQNHVLRPSALGKPALETAYKYFGLAEQENVSSELNLIFWFGHAFEQWFSVFLEHTNIEVLYRQAEHELFGLKGSSDFLVFDGEQRWILDTKAINARTFNEYKKYGLNDDRGYASQLAFYSEASGYPAAIVMLNKETYEIYYVTLPEEMKEKCLKRMQHIIKVLHELDEQKALTPFEKFGECFRHFRPPIPQAEVFKKQPTGRYLLPSTMRFSPIAPLLYETYTEKNGYKKDTTYVCDYKYPVHLQSYKPDIEQDVFG